MGCMSNLMGAEKQEDGREMETAGAQTSFFFKVFFYLNLTHLLNAYYVSETPQVLLHEMPSLNLTGQD